MKVTYTIWVSDRQNHTATREIDSFYTDQIREGFEAVLDLRSLEIENRKLRDELYHLKNKDEVVTLAKATIDESPPKIYLDIDTDPHLKVFEYDGAFKCLACHREWGALPGKPSMPEECKKTAEERFPGGDMA